MTKAILSISISMVVALCSTAQPTITSANFPPVGQESDYTIISNSNLNNTGQQNYIANYNQQQVNSYHTFSYINPVLAPDYSKAPQSNVALKVTGTSLTTYYNYYKAANDKVEIHGEKVFSDFSDANQSFSIRFYTDPKILIKFPFNYNDSFIDSFSEAYSANCYRAGVVSAVYNGYGTLSYVFSTGNNRTINNVARVKYSELINTLGPLACPNFPDTRDYSIFFSTDYNLPILMTGDLQTDNTKAYMLRNPSIYTSVSEINSNSASIFTDHYNHEIELIFPTSPVNTKVVIFNTLGQVLAEKPVNQANEKLSIAEYPQGMLLVTITANNKAQQTFKVLR